MCLETRVIDMEQYNDINIEASRAKLLNLFGGSPDLVFIRGAGNLGDELIWAGTRQLLSGLSYREIHVRELKETSGHTALFTGGGGWCEPFHRMPTFLPIAEQRFQMVIILPTSFDINQKTVRTTLEKTNAMVFARELVSYQQIRTLCNADLAHDCAFFFDYDEYIQNGEGMLNAFRTDAESINMALPEGNNDISKTCSSLDEWLRTIGRHDIIRTDRAHVMIAGAMLGKRVEYLPSSYHKVPAIADYALKNYPVTRITEAAPDGS
jgi:exopolysaccharide biosynthesis predicted pyruvyltransferase EpsI